MKVYVLRWLGHLALLSIIVTACSLAGQPTTSDPGQPPGSGAADTALVDAATVDEAPASLPAAQPQSPSAPTPSAFLSWVQNLRPTALLAGPADDAARFTMLPPQSYLKILQAQAGWLLVVYGGDGAGRAPGNAWVRAADVGPAGSAPRWVKNHRETNLWLDAQASTPSATGLPQWSWLELAGQENSGRLMVRYPGDGRTRPPGQAWVTADDVGPVQAPDRSDIPRGFPATVRSDVVRLQVPYRSQLDGTPWAEANCGPTALSMVLEAMGVNLSSKQVRQEVLNAQQLWGNDVGVYMEALAKVAQAHGLQVVDLYQGQTLKRWSPEDIRRHVQAGRPVIIQAYYRGLPGREQAGYYGDHYVIITGLVGNDFLYNDSIDADGVGFDRLMTPDQLQRAMNASAEKYAYAGFALGKGR